MRLITDNAPESKSEKAFANILEEILNYRDKLAQDRHRLNQGTDNPKANEEVEKKYNEVMELLKILVKYNDNMSIPLLPPLENDKIIGGYFSKDDIKKGLQYPETPEQKELFNANLDKFMDAFISGRKNPEGERVPDSGMKALESRRGHSPFVTKILDAINSFTNNLFAKITGKNFKEKILSIDTERRTPEGPEPEDSSTLKI